jgi:hypothetical protein
MGTGPFAAWEYPEICYNHAMGQQIMFLGCGLTLLGVIVALAGLIALQPAIRSARWPSTDGEVLAVSPAPQGDQRRVLVTYRFKVGGADFTGRSLTSARQFRSKQGLPPATDSSVRVHYHPTDPERSRLEPGAGAALFLPLGLGGLLFVVGLLLATMSFFL